MTADELASAVLAVRTEELADAMRTQSSIAHAIFTPERACMHASMLLGHVKTWVRSNSIRADSAIILEAASIIASRIAR